MSGQQGPVQAHPGDQPADQAECPAVTVQAGLAAAASSALESTAPEPATEDSEIEGDRS